MEKYLLLYKLAEIELKRLLKEGTAKGIHNKVWMSKPLVRETMTEVGERIGIHVGNTAMREFYAQFDEKKLNGVRYINLESLLD